MKNLFNEKMKVSDAEKICDAIESVARMLRYWRQESTHLSDVAVCSEHLHLEHPSVSVAAIHEALLSELKYGYFSFELIK